MNRRAKSCGKDGQKAPLEIAGAISTFRTASTTTSLTIAITFHKMQKTSVASLRGLIGSSRNIDRHQSGMLIGFIGIPIG